MKEEHCIENKCRSGRHRGPSSYYIHDSEKVFEMLDLKPHHCFVDLGCGRGDYSLKALDILKDNGEVVAVDKEGIFLEGLKTHKENNLVKNLRIVETDIRGILPIENEKADVCLVSTVFHCIDMAKYGKDIAFEIRRILKPYGKLVVIECKKEDTFRGPPLHLRFSPEDIEKIFTPFGFEKISVTSLGENYLIVMDIKK